LAHSSEILIQWSLAIKIDIALRDCSPTCFYTRDPNKPKWEFSGGFFCVWSVYESYVFDEVFKQIPMEHFF
jgi:hypothetical protein